jgi:hypothetical protein
MTERISIERNCLNDEIFINPPGSSSDGGERLKLFEEIESLQNAVDVAITEIKRIIGTAATEPLIGNPKRRRRSRKQPTTPRMIDGDGPRCKREKKS